MREIKKVQGSKDASQPLIVGKDTVYVHSNITDLGNGLFEYDEIQYTHSEYMVVAMEQNASMQTELLNAQLAIIELTEKVV